MLRRIAGLLALLTLLAIGVSAQGLDTKSSPNDWEEINFEYNSSVLVDGFPSLLRLSELLQKNTGYRVKLEGHTDRLGGDSYNDRLGLARANTIRDFLVKYGARPGQIEVSTRGKVDPKYPGQKPTYTKTDEARWMNRRVVLTVMDDQGRTVSAAGVGDAIRAIEPPKPQGMTDCCSEVLRRLDKLDDIAKLLKDLADQNADLRRQLDGLKQAQQVLESKVNQPAGPAAPSADQVASAVSKEIDRKKEPKFQLLGANVGMDGNGDVTATAKGRFFGVFADHYAFQAQGEYMYFKSDKEGQFDLGLVDRIGRHFQAGVFGSFKHVTLGGYQTGGSLGQAAITVDYIFKHGRVGVFGTYAFLDDAVINNVATVLPNGITSPDLFTQTYLRVVNQAGASFSYGLWGNNYLEGNLGYLKSYAYGDRAGGTLRFVFPINDKIAFTVEGGLNETILGTGNKGSARVGVQFGNVIRPKEMLETDHPVPMDVPRVRYEVLTRTVRTGHTPPVADAGPDQIGVPSGPITLNGSNSYSPDGLPITYQWIQQAGPAVALSNATSAMTSFAAAANQAYIFQLTVTDSLGGKGSARVHVTTTNSNAVNILFFIANPTQISAGQSATLSWNVQNASNVSISGIGNVASSGSAPVSPTATTTYTLTATNGNNSQNATATVVVSGSTTKVTYCYASPANIIAGESATLFYQTTNATSVSVSPAIGASAVNGNIAVSPTSTTNYTITAAGPNGATDTCVVGVTVTNGQLPRIIRFSPVPASINSGQSSELLWVVENATSVSISNGIGNVSLGGTQSVSPTATVTYVLSATNAAGTVTSQATVNVTAAVKITSFTATPNPSPSAGSPVVLACAATNASTITLAGQVTNGTSATVTVNPQTSTTYTCIATGAGGATDQQTLTEAVNGTTTGGGNQPPTIIIAGGPTINTGTRFLTLDASKSVSPSGNNPLSFVWTSLNDRALILNAGSATPSVQLGTVSGSYIFQLTVTDSKGNSATAFVTVNLIY
jgi:hypothetical protein